MNLMNSLSQFNASHLSLPSLLPNVTYSQPIFNDELNLSNTLNSIRYCEIAKDLLKTYVDSQWWGKCEGDTCFIGAKVIGKYQSNLGGCRFSLTSDDGSNADFKLDGERLSLALKNKIDSVTTETDFKNFINSNWIFNSEKFVFFGEDLGFVNEQIPLTGSFSIVKGREGSLDYVDIQFENNETKISGRCHLGMNEIECEKTNSGTLNKLLGGKIKAIYSNELTSEGIEVIKLNLQTTTFIPSVNLDLGTFELRLNQLENEFAVTGQLKILEETLFDGELMCKNNTESCSGEIKTFGMKYGMGWEKTAEKTEASVKIIDANNHKVLTAAQLCKDEKTAETCEYRLHLDDGTKIELTTSVPR